MRASVHGEHHHIYILAIQLNLIHEINHTKRGVNFPSLQNRVNSIGLQKLDKGRRKVKIKEPST